MNTHNHPQQKTAGSCFLHRSVPGEYLGMGLLFHSGLGAALWALGGLYDPLGYVFVVVGVWVACRAAGGFSGQWFSPLISLGLMVVVATIWQSNLALPLPALAMFSPAVFLCMLSVIFITDWLDLSNSPDWPWVVVWATALAGVAYVVVVPTTTWIIQVIHPPSSIRVAIALPLVQQFGMRAVEVLVAILFVSLGGIVGSYLNVVAYRVPLGESVVRRRSSCPQCGTQIDGRDNVPVFGWLLLKGRCRACQASISARYPIVETVTAAMFLVLYLAELISGGANVPVREPNLYRGALWIILYTKWDLVGLYVFHCLAMSTLLTWALIDIDGQRLPWRSRCLAGIVLLILPVVWHNLLPVDWLRNSSLDFRFPVWMNSAVTSLCGGSVGLVMGWIAVRVFDAHTVATHEPEQTKDAPTPYRHLAAAGMVVGLSVGWQAAMGTWLLALALRLFVLLMTQVRAISVPPTSCVLLGAFIIHLVCWRWLTIKTLGWLPTSASTVAAWTLLGLAFACLLLANRFVSRLLYPLASKRQVDTRHQIPTT